MCPAMIKYLNILLFVLYTSSVCAEASFFCAIDYKDDDAENVMVLHNISAYAGDFITVKLEILNDAEFVGFNLDIPLPDGFSYVEGSAMLFRKTNHMLSFNITSMNVVRVLAFSITNDAFEGNDGVILEFELETPYEPGTYPLIIENAVIGNIHAQNILTNTIDAEVILLEPDEPEFFEVVFNVDAYDAIWYGQLHGFDPGSNYLTITGNMTNWAEPGTDPELFMDLVCEEQMIFQKTFYLEAGHYEYKYFSDVIGEGWYGGEWVGGPNRDLWVTGNTTVNDVFSDGQLHFSVTFNVFDEHGGQLSGATITLGDQTNEPDDYLFQNVLMGGHNYSVMKAGFYDETGYVEVYSDTTISVSMINQGLSVNDDCRSRLLLYPNPVHNKLFIEYVKRIKEIRIIDARGHIVSLHIIDSMNHVIGVIGFKPGIYLVQVVYDDGVLNRKILIN